jgi:hypothetical protein
VHLAPPKDYEAGLSVDYASQVSAGVGTNSAVGTVVGGGVALFWSDMLGDHNLLTAVQAEGNSETFGRNLAAIIAYQNREDRMYWGAAVGQVPSIQVAYEAPVNNGDGTSTEALIRQWQINREVSGNVAYPFTRADRVEFSVGYRHIDYVRDALEVTYINATGEVVGQNIVDRPAPPSIDLYPVGVAFVHDTSVFGGTAPVKGSRYRAELGALAGTLDVYSPLVDYRQYFMPWEYLSLAGRVMHYGRYGMAPTPRIRASATCSSAAGR